MYSGLKNEYPWYCFLNHMDLLVSENFFACSLVIFLGYSCQYFNVIHSNNRVGDKQYSWSIKVLNHEALVSHYHIFVFIFTKLCSCMNTPGALFLMNNTWSSCSDFILCFKLQAIASLKKGSYLLKYGRRGKPKFCPFRLSSVSYSGNLELFPFLNSALTR